MWSPLRPLLTVGFIAVQRLDGEQEMLVLEVLDLGEDGLELRASREGGYAVGTPAPCTGQPGGGRGGYRIADRSGWQGSSPSSDATQTRVCPTCL